MRTNLFKSLLVAVMAIGAMGGVNAATGDVKTNVDIDFSNAISENKVNGTVGSLNITQDSNIPTEISNGILVLGNGIHNVIIPESERANDKDIVTTSFDLAFGKLSKRFSYFYFEDADGNRIGSFELDAYWSTLTNDFGIETADMYYGYNTPIWKRRATFTITYDYAKKSITTAVLNHKENKTATHTVAMSSTKPIAKFCIGSNYSSNPERRCLFDNLKITTTEGNYSNKTISIKYTTEDGLDIPNENIPENTVFTYSEAANTEFTPTYPSTFSTDDYIYTYVSGGDAFTVTEDKTVTLVYKKENREKVNIVLNCIDENGETLEQQTVATNYPIDKSFIYGINKYIIKDGKLYEANKIDEKNNYYVASVNATATPIDIKYKKVNTTGTPIYFADFGDEPNTNTSSTEYMRASGGQTAASNSKVVLVPANVLAPGYYDFEIAHYKNRAPKFNVGDKEYGVCSTATNSGTMATTVFKNVLVINGEEISVTPGGSSYTDNMDYVLVTRTGDATETVSVSGAGYATYATTNNVVVPSDVEVMTVTVNEGNSTITLNEIEAGTEIPANTGILVKATAGNHDFVVTSKEVAKLENNNLVAAKDAVTSDGSTFFALTTLNDGKVGFAVVKEGVNIPAGKAYLKVPGKTAAKFFGLDGEATGINSVKTAKADGAYYTLEGVKTTKPVKGLYIHNGKKIVVK